MRKAKQDNHAKSGFDFQHNCIKSRLLNNGTSTANVIAECKASNDATHMISSGVVVFFGFSSTNPCRRNVVIRKGIDIIEVIVSLKDST